MRYDVVIVGAGPAGSTAAKYLAEHNVKVLLLEKYRLPREKPCGGGLPYKVVKCFPYIKEQGLISAYAYGGSMGYRTFNTSVIVELDEPLIAMVHRSVFDYQLVQLAVHSGATILEETTATNVTVTSDGATITLQDGSTVDASLVIGADGVQGIVAKKTHLCPHQSHLCPCIYEEQPLTKEFTTMSSANRNLFHIIFKFEDIKGYGWVFQKKTSLNIGIGEFAYGTKTLDEKKNLRDVYSKFICTLKDHNILPQEYRIGKLRGGTLPSQPLEKVYGNRVLLVGDAAGFVNPVSGAGIYYAMTSGMLAATIASQALAAGDTSERFLSKYQEMFWTHPAGKELRFMIRFNRRWGDKIGRFFTVVSSDKMLSDCGMRIIAGQVDQKELRGKMVRRFLLVYLKTFFRRKK